MVALITLAAAGHCGFAPNLFALITDMFPGSLVGAVAGIGGMASSVAALCFAETAGRLLEADVANYQVLFGICSVAYVAALAVMHVLSPRLAEAGLSRK